MNDNPYLGPINPTAGALNARNASVSAPATNTGAYTPTDSNPSQDQNKQPRYSDVPYNPQRVSDLTQARDKQANLFAPKSEDTIRADVERQYSDTISAIKNQYASLIGNAQEAQAKDINQSGGKSRAMAASSGLLSSDIGEAQISEAEQAAKERGDVAIGRLADQMSTSLAGIAAQKSQETYSRLRDEQQLEANQATANVTNLQDRQTKTLQTMQELSKSTTFDNLPPDIRNKMFTDSGFDTFQEFQTNYEAMTKSNHLDEAKTIFQSHSPDDLKNTNPDVYNMLLKSAFGGDQSSMNAYYVVNAPLSSFVSDKPILSGTSAVYFAKTNDLKNYPNGVKPVVVDTGVNLSANLVPTKLTDGSLWLIDKQDPGNSRQLSPADPLIDAQKQSTIDLKNAQTDKTKADTTLSGAKTNALNSGNTGVSGNVTSDARDIGGVKYVDLSGYSGKDRTAAHTAATKQGIVPITDKNQVNDLINIQDAFGLTDYMTQTLTPIVSKDWLTRDLGGAASKKLSSYLQADDITAATQTFDEYGQEIQKALSGLSGQRGGKYNIDIVIRNLPKVTDTIGVLKNKIKFLNEGLKVRSQSILGKDINVGSNNAPTSSNSLSVTAPDGNTYTFKDQKSLDNFKSEAGIK